MGKLLRGNAYGITALLILTFMIIFLIPEDKKVLRTAHFTFIYSPVISYGKILAISSVLEGNYARMSRDFNTIPPKNIEVNIYAARWRYIKATGHWLASGNVEGTSELHLVENSWGKSQISRVAVHEFCHAVVLKMLLDQEAQPLDRNKFDVRFSKYPVWLWEALSLYEAGQFRNPRNFSFLNSGSYPELDELNDRTKGQKIYEVGYTIIEYILHHYGRTKLILLIKSDGNVSKVLQVSKEDFSRDWYEYISQKYLKKDNAKAAAFVQLRR